MDNEINNEVTIASLDKMIYHAIYETRYIQAVETA